MSWRGGCCRFDARARLALLVWAVSAASAATAAAQPGAITPGADGANAAYRPSPACTLLLTEHRSRRPLLQTPWPTRTLSVSFVHSVLGTPVEDRYVWRDAGWVLVEERFSGEGYGLPHAPAAGEQWLQQDGQTRLLLNRSVTPLVIRSLAAQRMQLRLDDGRQWRLAELSAQAVELHTQGC